MSNGGILGFKWLEDPNLFNLGCGDNSCKYVKPSGMATNGGCRCALNKSNNVERFLLRNIAKLHQANLSLQADLEIEKVLDASAERTQSGD